MTRLRLDPCAPVITGLGMYVPEDVLTNDTLARIIDPGLLRRWVEENRWCRERMDELGREEAAGSIDERNRRLFAAYVEERVGIRERHVVDLAAIVSRTASKRGIFASDLGAEAARVALADAGLEADEVDVILCGTSSPDGVFPTTAVAIQERLGARRAWAFDVLAACTSFVFALETARLMVLSGACRRALVVAAEYFTCSVDYRDPSNSFFWGDAGAAVVVQSAATARREPQYEILDSLCLSVPSDNIRTGLGGTRAFLASGANGHRGKGGEVEIGGSAYPYFYQNGPRVYREVAPMVVEVIQSLLERARCSTDDIRLFMFHQPSRTFLRGIARRLLNDEDPWNRVPVHLERLGNTSSCGVAICLVENDTLQPRELTCLAAFGGGYTVGATLLRRL